MSSHSNSDTIYFTLYTLNPSVVLVPLDSLDSADYRLQTADSKLDSTFTIQYIAQGMEWWVGGIVVTDTQTTQIIND